MTRNTRSLVTIDLPPRYAQTFVITPDENEAKLYRLLDTYLRWRCQGRLATRKAEQPLEPVQGEGPAQLDLFADRLPGPSTLPADLSRMRITSLLLAAGSHPAALVAPLVDMADQDDRVGPVLELARKAGQAGVSAKEARLVELVGANRQGKALVFANFSATLDRLADVLSAAGIPFSAFTGRQSAAEKAEAVDALRNRVPVMLCSEIGGEGHNLQFANTLINFDLPWNPMRIEQRVGRIHRIGQTREVFIFNLCTAGSLEERILRLLQEKIRMFELVVGEVGSILGNLEGGDEFESLVLGLWLKSQGPADLDRGFEQLGDSLLAAQEEYLQARRLDEALFGDEYE
jgi:SNF2 family DNA or RNA helicase